MADLRAAVASGVGWTAAQKWLVRISGVLTFVVLSRLLSPAEIGSVALAVAFLGVLGVVADLGAATFLVQTRSWDEPTRSTTFWTTLVLSGVGTAMVLVLGGPMAGLLGEPRLTGVFQALAPILAINAASGVPTAILQRELRFRELALREMISALVSAAAGVALAFAGAGVWALVAQTLVQAAVASVLIWRMSAWRPTRQVSRAAFTELRKFGGPVLAINILQSVRDRLEQFLMGAMLGVAALGYWTVAVRLLALLADVSVAVFDSVALPVFAAARDSAPRFQRAFEGALSSTQVLMVPMLSMLAVGSPVVLPLAFGNGWGPAIVPAQVLCLVYGVAGLAYFNRAALLAHGRSGVECLLTATGLAMHLGIVLAVGPHGLVPLAWAFGAEAVVTVLLGAAVLRSTLAVGWTTLRRPATVVASGLVATTVGLTATQVVASRPVTSALAGASVAAVVLAGALWWTSAGLLRELGDDVLRLLRRQPAPA